MTRAAETTPARFLVIAEGTKFLGRQLTNLERHGFRGFFRDIADPTDDYLTGGSDWSDGYILARQVAFAQGALAEIAHDSEDEPINPYPPRSTAAQVWTEGFNAAANAALDIES